jgi:hypothetical protein
VNGQKKNRTKKNLSKAAKKRHFDKYFFCPS